MTTPTEPRDFGLGSMFATKVGQRKTFYGFEMESTGCFFSGDGYKIVSVPGWVPEELRDVWMGKHAQDSVLFRVIMTLWQDTKDHHPKLTKGFKYPKPKMLRVKIRKMKEEDLSRYFTPQQKDPT
jgi:hypothetical protein